MSAIDEKVVRALGTEWTARFDFNAICRIEEAFDGRPFMETITSVLPSVAPGDLEDGEKIRAAAMKMKMGDVRLLLKEGFAAAHSGITLEQTGEIIQAIGVQDAMALLGWGVMRALGIDDDGDDDDKGGDAKGGANPRGKRKAKTG